MAYQKTFNPDALPAHAEPEQAAQALAHLSIAPPKPQNNARPGPGPVVNQSRPAYSDPGRPQQQHQHQQPQPQQQQHQNQHQHQQPPPQSRPYNIQNNQGQYNQPYRQTSPQQNYNNYAHSPPPSSQSGRGWAPRPPAPSAPQQWSTSTAHNLPPRTPAPPDPDSADLYPLFRAANSSGTGSLTRPELGNALVNADFTPFDPRTINSLMRMFSNSPPGQPQGPTITYNEFQNLWRFLAEWRKLFERFDEDHSGRINQHEFSNALVAFGYRLSTPFISLVYNFYTGSVGERRGSRGSIQGLGITFDLFVQACISLKHMTDVFKGYDDDRDGYVTLSFEEFLTEMLRMLESSH